ncbi:hypothetical protein ACW5W8_23225 [Aeromonas aquatilis]
MFGNNDSTGQPGTTIEQKVEDQKINGQFTRTVLARMNQEIEGAVATQGEMLYSMAHRKDPLDGTSLVEINHSKKRVADLEAQKERILPVTSTEYTAHDVDAMREMKKANISEDRIANYYETNQAKINRLLNGKSPVS